jgi:hypothetical protein
LPPDIAASFNQSLSLLQKFAAEHFAAVAASQQPSYADAVAGACGVVAPSPSPVSAGAGGVFHTPGGPPAPLGPTCAAAAPLGTLPLPHVLGPQQVAPTFGVVDLTSSPPPLMSPALAAVGRLNRGRRMGGAVPPITAEASDSGDFIPVGRRSRSAPGRRMRTKTPDYGFSQVQEVEEGSRYFSQQAERAGLDG